jgi:hypothetical protein
MNTSEQGTNQVTLQFKGTGLQALGWVLVATMLTVLIIPAAWGAVALYRWFIRSLSFSDGTEASFEGRGREVWGYFVVIALLSFAPLLYPLIKGPDASTAVRIGLSIVLLPLNVAIWLIIFRWFFASVKLSCGTSLKFKGRY